MPTGSLLGDVLEAHPNHMDVMCGRVIQSSGSFNLAIVRGMNVHDRLASNYPRRYNAAPRQELLVIRRNRDTREVSLDPLRWGLIPYWCKDPKGGRKPINAKAETVVRLPMFRDAYSARQICANGGQKRTNRQPTSTISKHVSATRSAWAAAARRRVPRGPAFKMICV